jgi:NAD(P)-dependent dehydrogenase (short-subunit alcohol dehydrogenase family)
MPNVQTIRAGIAELPKGLPLVVALTGGTTGIGSYVARALATTFKNHGSKLRVYIVGRNTARAETLLAYGREISPGSDWRFVRATDLSLMNDVDRTCEAIMKQEEEAPFAGGPARLDVLYMSQALSPLQASHRTTEGIDAQMSLLYYSRMRFIQKLTPLLTAAPGTAHVVSIFAGSMEGRVQPGETQIGTPPAAIYGATAVRNYTVFMKTFFFEKLAEKHAGKISFIHIYPGLVDGPTFYTEVNPSWFRILWRVLKPILWLYMTSPEACGELMLYLATLRYPAKGTAQPDGGSKASGGVAYSTQRELGGGAYGVGRSGDENKTVSYERVRKDDTAKKVWDHTMEILAEIESKNTGSQG